MEDRYLILPIPFLTDEIPTPELRAALKMDDEGVVIDILDENDEPVASTWKLYSDFGIKSIEWDNP